MIILYITIGCIFLIAITLIILIEIEKAKARREYARYWQMFLNTVERMREK